MGFSLAIPARALGGWGKFPLAYDLARYKETRSITVIPNKKLLAYLQYGLLIGLQF